MTRTNLLMAQWASLVMLLISACWRNMTLPLTSHDVAGLTNWFNHKVSLQSSETKIVLFCRKNSFTLKQSIPILMGTVYFRSPFAITWLRSHNGLNYRFIFFKREWSFDSPLAIVSFCFQLIIWKYFYVCGVGLGRIFSENKEGSLFLCYSSCRDGSCV